MDWFDATTLPSSMYLPAPHEFIQFFKVLGFTLHMVPMNLWYAGIVLAMVMAAFGGEYPRRFAARLMRPMPILVALGINFGIVPLLFVQVEYYRAFYPATILMAWPWLSIIAMLIPAYYGVYLYTYGLRAKEMTSLARVSGYISAALFLVIGFFFANGLSLMTRVSGWRGLWLGQEVGGAVWGTALNLTDSSLWPRWILMFGLAMLTTAAWMNLDTTWFAGRETPQYRAWAERFCRRFALAGAIVATVAGGGYLLTWDKAQEAMYAPPLMFLTAVTAMSPWAPWLVLFLWHAGEPRNRSKAAVVAGVQFGVLALNAISRQIVQNLELFHRLFDVSALPKEVQWGPMALFLGTFVVGVGVLVWILLQLRTARPVIGQDAAP